MNRYKGGVDTYLQVITSQTINLTNQRTEADILRRRMDASVLLIKALGGGWNLSNCQPCRRYGDDGRNTGNRTHNLKYRI